MVQLTLIAGSWSGLSFVGPLIVQLTCFACSWRGLSFVGTLLPVCRVAYSRCLFSRSGLLHGMQLSRIVGIVAHMPDGASDQGVRTLWFGLPRLCFVIGLAIAAPVLFNSSQLWQAPHRLALACHEIGIIHRAGDSPSEKNPPQLNLQGPREDMRLPQESTPSCSMAIGILVCFALHGDPGGLVGEFVFSDRQCPTSRSARPRPSSAWPRRTRIDARIFLSCR